MMRALLLAGAVAIGWAGVVPSAARADVLYNYQFTVGSSYSYPAAGDTANLSGTFTWDATTSAIVASMISVSGYDSTGSNRGFVNCTACTTGLYGSNNFAIGTNRDTLYIVFASNLSLGASNSLVTTQGNSAEYQGGEVFRYATGGVTLVPEPASLALLGLGVAGIAAVRRRRVG